MILPYLDVFGNEVFNAARTVAYLRRLYDARLSGHWEISASSPCSRLLHNLAGSSWTFVNPTDDHGASGFPLWVNSNFPESGEFLGALITDIVGLSSTASRSLVSKPAGGKLGNQRHEPRTIQVKGYLVGSPCGIAYGARWFNDYLGALPCVDCAPKTFGFYKACPGDNSRWAAPHWDGYWRVKNAGIGVGLVTHPVHARDLTTGTIADAGCDLVEFEVSLIAANPWLYKPASYSYAPSGGAITFTLGAPPVGVDGIDVTWVNAAAGSITQDAVVVFSFAGAPTPNTVEYDSAQHTFTVDGVDGAKYITSLVPGQALPWVEAGECIAADQSIVVDTSGSSGASALVQHREG